MQTRYLDQQRKWDLLADTWIDAGPPASPSAGDIKIYKELLSKSLQYPGEGKIILLGSTPKIRDIFLSQNGFRENEVFCIDFSEKMYLQTSKTLKKNPREQFVLGNWLDFNIGSRVYDVVMGDKAIDNIMPEDWQRFFGQVHSHLRTGGSFIVHLALADERFRGIGFSGALAKWSAMYADTKQPMGQIVAGLWEEILTASAFKDGYHNTVTIDRFSDEVERLLDQ